MDTNISLFLTLKFLLVSDFGVNVAVVYVCWFKDPFDMSGQTKIHCAHSRFIYYIEWCASLGFAVHIHNPMD